LSAKPATPDENAATGCIDSANDRPHGRSMTSDSSRQNTPITRPCAGRSAWVITDGKIGMDVQARGVADALGVDYQVKHVTPQGIWKFAAPWGPVGPDVKFGKPDSAFAPPWPDLAIATGRASIPYIRALRRRAGSQTYCVVLQDPKTGPNTADVIWVPEHDQRRGTNVITTPTAPHSFTQDRLAKLRAVMPPDIKALTGPRIAVILGGKNGIYRFSDADDDRLQRALTAFGKLGASFMVTPSRRSHQRLIRAVDQATASSSRILWDGTGSNPYPDFLAHADALVVTADSVNMTGEACATGRPVYVFMPSGGSAKFTRFHEALQRHGATRPLPEAPITLDTWTYEPLHSGQTIASEIERRWQQRRAVMPGLP
jgi:uncharacterized protein